MKYCVNCRKIASALGLDGLTLCVAGNHEIIDVTFQEIYEMAQRRGAQSAKGCKLSGICSCHHNSVNCCSGCKI